MSAKNSSVSPAFPIDALGQYGICSITVRPPWTAYHLCPTHLAHPLAFPHALLSARVSFRTHTSHLQLIFADFDPDHLAKVIFIRLLPHPLSSMYGGNLPLKSQSHHVPP